jgi:hypothetical protein
MSAFPATDVAIRLTTPALLNDRIRIRLTPLLTRARVRRRSTLRPPWSE